MIRRNLLLVGLLLSLAANLFFVGGIAYRMYRMPDFRDMRPFPPNVGWIVRDLSEERRQQLEPLLRQSAEVIRPLRSTMFQTQRRVNELMAAPEFSADELGQAFADLRNASDQYQSLSHQQTVVILQQLSAEERRVALEFVQRRGPRDGRDGFRGRDGGPGFGPRPGPDGLDDRRPQPTDIPD
jgi:uncharacterized membrane protein